MSSFLMRLSSTAAVVLAAGLLAAAGPSDQPSTDGPAKARVPAVWTAAPDLPSPDENVPAERRALGSARVAELVPPGNFSYLFVPGTAMRPRTSTTPYTYQPTGCVSMGPGDFLNAEVQLPDGATIKYLRLVYKDTDAAANVTGYISRYDPGTALSDLVSVSSTGSAGYGFVVSTALNEVVDNSTYTYVVLGITGSATSSNQICGMRVAYYAPPQGQFTAIPPCRVVDTRGGAPLGGGFLPSATERVYTLAGNCGIPAGATGVSLNATVTQVAGPGFLSLWQTGTAYPTVSTLNFNLGETQVNAAIVPLNASGQLSVALGVNGAHVILDVNGYYY